MPSPHQPTAKDLTLRLWQILNDQAYDSLPEVLTPDSIIEWPQSRERIRGYRALQQIMQAYPGGAVEPAITKAQFAEGDEAEFLMTPMFTVVRTEAAGDHATSMITTRYPDGSDWYIITIAKARDGKIVHSTQFFAPMYEAPEWRKQWVEQMDEA